MTNTITAATLADLFGVTTRTVADLTKRGIVVKAKRGYALAESVRGYCDHLRKLAMGRGGEAAIASATVERARLAREQADHIALKNAAARGELVRAADVETQWGGVLRTVRAGMLAVPSRAAQRLPHLSAHDVSIIDSEVRDVLTEIGEGK